MVLVTAAEAAAAGLKAAMEKRSIQLLQEAIPQAKKCGVDTYLATALLRQCEQVTGASVTAWPPPPPRTPPLPPPPPKT